jgi:hypothetical protein
MGADEGPERRLDMTPPFLGQRRSPALCDLKLHVNREAGRSPCCRAARAVGRRLCKVIGEVGRH